MIYGYIIIIMKEQILSRIQSYQNMPIRNGLKNSKNSIERKDQLIN
jgi:phosphoserine aminotransferase